MHRTSLKSSLQNPTFELPAVVKDYKYFLVSIPSTYQPNPTPVEWKLRDESGCEHSMPYFFTKGRLEKFTIVNGNKYNDICELRSYPKDLAPPIAKYYSISTIEISPAEKYFEPPLARSRRKGEQDWTNGVRVTFGSPNEIHECQLIYKLSGGIIVSSPILEVTCLWNSFDIEKDLFIDYEEMLVHRKLLVSVKPNTFYKTTYRSTIRLIEPINNENYNKIIDVEANKDFSIDLGARYELTMHIPALDVSYSRIIQVPQLQAVDSTLWIKNFGDTDQAVFQTRITRNDDREEFILYRHGAFIYRTIRSWSYSVSCKGGSFTLTKLDANDSVNLTVELLHLFREQTKPKPSVTLSPIINAFDDQVPAALHLPELTRLIATYTDFERFKLRLVCKAWYHLVPPTFFVAATSKSVDLYGQKFIRPE